MKPFVLENRAMQNPLRFNAENPKKNAGVLDFNALHGKAPSAYHSKSPAFVV
jgi:hypothetical protein